MSQETAQESETYYPFGEPQVVRDHDGRALVLMPLRNSERCAKVLVADWNKLADLEVSATWFCASREHPYVRAGSYERGGHINVARLIGRCSDTRRCATCMVTR